MPIMFMSSIPTSYIPVNLILLPILETTESPRKQITCLVSTEHYNIQQAKLSFYRLKR